MEQDSVDSLLVEIKQEPTGEFAPQADDGSTAPPEESLANREEDAKAEFTQNKVKEEARQTNDDRPITKIRLKNGKYCSTSIHDCTMCDLKFTNRLYLNHHQNEIHGIMFNCDKCPHQSPHMKGLLRHKRTHNRSIGCETCHQKFSLNEALKTHQMQHRHGIYATAPEVTFKCNICSKSFSTPKYLRTHQRKVHVENDAKCDVCGKIYKNRLAMNQHRQTHEQVECSVCKKMVAKYSLVHHLRTHLKAHSGSRATKISVLFHCDLCDYSTKAKRALKEHIERRHLLVKLENDSERREDVELLERLKLRYKILRKPRREQRIKCDQCSKRTKYFANLSTLNIHMRIFHAENLFGCSLCEEKFETKRALHCHTLKAHITPFTCPNCRHVLKTQRDFTRHLELCRRINPLKVECLVECDICRKTFQTKWLMRRHMLMHSSKKKFCCTKCGDAFESKSLFLSHERSRVIQCAACDVKFACKSLLDRHRLECEAESERMTSRHVTLPGEALIARAQREEDAKPQWTPADVKEEPPENYVFELPQTTIDQTQTARRQDEKKETKFCCTLNCTKCGEEFTSVNDLLRHLNSELTYKCVTCNVNFSCERLSDRHQHEFHRDLLQSDKSPNEAGNLKATGSHFEQPNQTHSTMEAVVVKQEPPEEFSLCLPTPDQEEEEEEEGDKEDTISTDVKIESRSSCF